MLAQRFAICLALGGSLICSAPALAAWETEVLTAAEKNNPLDVNLELTFGRHQAHGKITREWVQTAAGEARATEVKELKYSYAEHRLTIGLRLGLYHNLELHVFAPIVINEDTEIVFDEGVQGRSTIAESPNADDINHVGIPRYPLTGVAGAEGQRFRSGFGDMVFGLAWSPTVDGKHEAWPTTTLRADITAPTGSVRDPTDQAALDKAVRGGIGLGQTVFDLSLGVSKRMGKVTPTLDPYLILGSTIPISNPAQQEKGMDAPATGRFVVGTEVLILDEPQEFQRYAIDVSLETRYTAPGRTYSPLSDYLPNFDQTKVLGNRASPTDRPDEIIYGDFADPRNYASPLEGAHCGSAVGVPCGELNAVDEYVSMVGTVALFLRFAEFAVLRGGVAMRYDTDHFITNERVGKDLDPANTTQLCDGAPCAGRVNARNSFYDRANDTCPPGQTCDERSKYYDPRYDAPGRRLRIESIADFTFFISGSATF